MPSGTSQQRLIGDGAAGDASIEQGAADRRAAGRVLRAVHAGAGNFARGVQVRDHRAVWLHDARGDVRLEAAECDGHTRMQTQGDKLGALDRVQEFSRLAEVLVDATFDQLAVAAIGRLQRRRALFRTH